MQVAHCRIHGHFVDSEGVVTSGTNRYPPRLIIGHPLSLTVTPGQPASLAVLPGDPALAPFRYQWRRLDLFDAAGLAVTNIQVLDGATNRTYELTSATASDEGYYDVIVEDALGGRQLSHLAHVRVESVDNALAIDGWEAAALHRQPPRPATWHRASRNPVAPRNRTTYSSATCLSSPRSWAGRSPCIVPPTPSAWRLIPGRR